jgi:hypothetical protein
MRVSLPLGRRVEDAVTLRAVDVLAHRSHESLGGTVMGEQRFPGAGAQDLLAEKEAPVVGPDLELRRPSKCLDGVRMPAEPAQQGTSQEVRLRVERTHPDQAIDRGQALRRSPTSREGLDETSMSLEAAGLEARRLAVIHARLEPAAGSCERVTAGEMCAGTVGEYTQGVGVRPSRPARAAQQQE